MSLATIYLAWGLSQVCVLVTQYRRQGYTDAVIEEGARARLIPERVIQWAKHNCKRS